MSQDSLLREVRTTREAYARSHGYDAWAVVADLRQEDACGGWPVVRLAPRPAVPGGEVAPATGLDRGVTGSIIVD